MDPEHHHTLAKGALGAGANLLGVITSFQQELEWWLRITSLGVGVLVGILTAWSIIRKARRRP